MHLFPRRHREDGARHRRVQLHEREAEITRLYFGIGREHPLTLEEIGQRFGLTRERVRQIKEKALRKLRQKHRREELQMHIG